MQTTIERGWEMRKIQAKRVDVLETVRKNYEIHKKAYAEAFAGYKVEAAEILEARKKQFSRAVADLHEQIQAADLEKKQKPVRLTLPADLVAFARRPPEDHSAAYEVVISMLEFETRDVIEINQEEHESFILDRWSWKDEFLASHEFYSNKAFGSGSAAVSSRRPAAKS